MNETLGLGFFAHGFRWGMLVIWCPMGVLHTGDPQVVDIPLVILHVIQHIHKYTSVVIRGFGGLYLQKRWFTHLWHTNSDGICWFFGTRPVSA